MEIYKNISMSNRFPDTWRHCLDKLPVQKQQQTYMVPRIKRTYEDH